MLKKFSIFLITSFSYSCIFSKMTKSKDLKFLKNLEDLKSSSKCDKEGVFESFDKTKIAYLCFLSQKSTNSLILYHGAGANSRAGYTKFAENICKKYDTNVYLIDIRGHGLSDGNRGDCPRVESVWRDVDSAINFVKSIHNGKIFLAGHSSGAGLVLNYMNYSNSDLVDKIIFIAPEFGHSVDTKTKKEEKFAEVSLWKILANRFSGGRAFAHSSAVFFNYDEKVAKENNLVCAYSVNMALAVSPDNARKSLENLKIETIIIYAQDDEIINSIKLQKFIEKLKNKNISYKILEKVGHLSCLSVADYDLKNFF
jgi:acylglycerol lipase